MSGLSGGLLAGPRGRRTVLEIVWALSTEHSHGPVWWPGATARATTEVLSRVPLSVPSEQVLVRAIAHAVDAARYWQEPDRTDLLAARPEVAAVLAPWAELIEGADAPPWWSAPLDPDDQHEVRWVPHYGDGAAEGAITDATSELERWRAAEAEDEARAAKERPRNPAARWSGSWWSTPPLDLPTTTGRVPTDSETRTPAGLVWVEDSMGWTQAQTCRMRMPADARVLEVRPAGDWAALCAEWPLPVTASRRHDWYRATGEDHEWVIPDWAGVASRWDAIHLSTSAYLACAGVPIPTGDGRASVIAGWAPHETHWLVSLEPQGDTTQWVGSGEPGDPWAPVR